MPLQAFTPSTPLTMGVELELQLVSLSNFDLVAASPDMLELLSRKPFPGMVTPEVTESMLEIASSVHHRYDTLHAQLKTIRDCLVAAGEQLNVGLCGGGTHPFQMWSEQKIYAKPRFRELSSLYGYLAKQFTVFGQHIHIGCANGNHALYLLHALNRYVPQFVALAASSPFVQGNDTLFNSARLNSVFSFPLSGRAPFLFEWEDFETQYFAKMESTGIVTSMKDFYWDVRPKPEYGTIELRVCDTPLSVTRATALACYLQALCAYLEDGNDPAPEEDDYLVYNYNRFQACRFGLDGVIVHPRSHDKIGLREDILATLRKLTPYADTLASRDALDLIYTITHAGSDASFLRRAYRHHGSLEGVVDASIRQFRE